MAFTYIKNEEQIQNFCLAAQQIKIFSIDTEFQRQDTYYSIPALVQIAYLESDTLHAACFDAKTISNWSSLQALLTNADECVMHSSDQDFEIFDQIFPAWDFNICDTQLACALLGDQPQLGYAGMIKNELEIEIDKSQTRTNWLQRPLTKKQIDYALSDVTHLLYAWQKLQKKLALAERTHWFNADCKRLIPTHEKLKNNANAWKKVKGLRNLTQAEFVRAASLAEWRENYAQERNRPRRWIFNDEAILLLSQNPDNVEQLSKQSKAIKFNAKTIKQVLEQPHEKYDAIINYAALPLNDTEKKQYKKLKEFVNNKALELNIDPSTLSKRKTLEKLARGDSQELDQTNWRHQQLLSFIHKA